MTVSPPRLFDTASFTRTYSALVYINTAFLNQLQSYVKTPSAHGRMANLCIASKKYSVIDIFIYLDIFSTKLQVLKLRGKCRSNI